MFATLLHFVALFYHQPGSNAVVGLSMASPQWPDKFASHTVHELRSRCGVDGRDRKQFPDQLSPHQAKSFLLKSATEPNASCVAHRLIPPFYGLYLVNSCSVIVH